MTLATFTKPGQSVQADASLADYLAARGFIAAEASAPADNSHTDTPTPEEQA